MELEESGNFDLLGEFGYSASHSEEPCLGRGENFVFELRSGEGQDAFHGPGNRGRDGVGGEHALAGMAGKQLQEIRGSLRNHHRQEPRGKPVCEGVWRYWGNVTLYCGLSVPTMR